MTDKEKEMLNILKYIEYYSEKVDSLTEDIKGLEKKLTEYKSILEEKRKALEEV